MLRLVHQIELIKVQEPFVCAEIYEAVEFVVKYAYERFQTVVEEKLQLWILGDRIYI